MSDVASGNRHRGFDILADAKHQGHDGERFMRGYALREAFASSDTSVPPRFAAQVVDRRDREVVEISAVGLEGGDGPLTGQALLYRRHYDLRHEGVAAIEEAAADRRRLAHEQGRDGLRAMGSSYCLNVDHCFVPLVSQPFVTPRCRC
jgi:hypothetical protein